MTQHSRLEKEIMIKLQAKMPNARIFRFDAGDAYYIWSVDQGNPRRFKYGNPGWPDLVAGANGKAVGIEVKINDDVQNKDQVMIESSFKLMGWHYYIFTNKRSFDEQMGEVLCLLT